MIRTIEEREPQQQLAPAEEELVEVALGRGRRLVSSVKSAFATVPASLRFLNV